MKHMKRGLSWLLVLCMIASMLSLSAFAADETEATPAEEPAVEESVVETEPAAEAEEPAAEEEEVLAVEDEPMLTSGNLDTSTFYKMVLIDCGRGYYSVANIETIIDTMAANDYEYLMLGFGNDGLRFVLDDMSVGNYSSDTVKNAVISANDAMQSNGGNGQWTEDDMEDIIDYAESKDINIVPMLNCPGHAYSICKAMEACGISNSYVNTYGGYNYSVNLSNSTAMEFTETLVKKYIAWFADQGCEFFNLGCDETSNTDLAVTYVNDMCSYMPSSMVAMAFCDILKSTSGYPSNLVGIDWDGNHLSSSNYHINANDNWYYVLGTSESDTTGWSTYGHSLKDTKSISVTTTIGGEKAYGSILAVWNDSYLAADSYISNIQNLITSQATASINSEYFDVETEPEPTPTPETTTKEVTVAVDGTYTDELTGSQTKTTDSDTSIATTTTTEKEVAGTWSASASASIGAYTSDYTADNLIDGDTSTMYWSGDNQTVGAYVRVDLGTDQKVSAIRVTPYDTSDDSYCTANVQVSTDGTTWTTVGAYDGTKTTLVTFTETTARYIQVVITAAKSNWWKVAEIEWGSATTSGETEDVYNGQSVTLSQNNYTNYIGYYYKSGNSYYQITNITRTEGSSGGGKGGPGSSTYTISYNGTSTSVQSNTSITLYTKTEGSTTTFNQNPKSGSGASTTNTVVTIKGVAVGDTTAIVGNTTYNIHVVEEDVSGVTPLTINMHISTFSVWKVGDSTKTSTISLSASKAYGVDGIAITEVVPATGTWAYAADSSVASTVFWKGVKLTYANRQAATDSVDRSMSGVNYSKIRYYGGKWSVYDMDNNVWVDVNTSTSAPDEVDAYYLQKTEITSEVTTYVKDWAYTTQNASGATGATAQKALSFAVVYPDGQLSPETEDEIYTDSTLIYWNTTENMFIRVGVNEVYEVEKITYTAGERVNSSGTKYGSTASLWKSTDRISWNKTTTTDGSTWYDETTCWTPETSSEPVIDCSQIDAFSYTKGNYTTNDAILVLIYLKPVTTEDSLTVKYVDDSNNTEFLNYPLNVTNTSTEEKGTFLNRLKQTSPVQAGEFTLDDAAYVTNAKGTNETFQKDLTKIPSLMETAYASGLYKYQKAEISEDGKTLTLHYNLNSEIESVDYVIDFGLSIQIPVSDLNVQGSYDEVRVGSANYAYTEVSEDDKTITYYTPDDVLQGTDVFNVYFDYSDGKTVSKAVKIFPATTVYYEASEDFVTYSDGWSINKEQSEDVDPVTQNTAQLGSDDYNYGYDEAYLNEVYDETAVSVAAKNTATFTFTGTGVDIYANCSKTSGVAMISVKNAAGENVEVAYVNTASINGNSEYTNYPTGTLYNVPIYSLTGLDHGTYTVKIGTQNTDAFTLDGFKVYNTLADSSVFVEDDEDNPTFIEARDLNFGTIDLDDYSSNYTGVEQVYSDVSAAAEKATGNKQVTAVITSAAGATVVADQDLIDNGPKNEVYLYPGMSLTLNIRTDRKVEVGLRGLQGGLDCTVTDVYDSDNPKTVSVSNTDMYYTVEEKNDTVSAITITNPAGNNGILAVTKIKVCDDPNAVPAALTADDLLEALYELGFEKRPFVNPFEDVNEYDWSYKAILWAAENGIVYGMTESTFAPDAYCTRGQAVTFIWRAAGEPEAAEGTVNPFVDVTEDDYFYDAVLWAYEQGIVYGMDATHFAPARTCTRGQIIAIINRWAGEPTAAEGTVNTFNDVAADAYYYDAVLWGIEQGIVYGIEDGIFAPDNYCTRAQIVAFIYRYMTDEE